LLTVAGPIADALLALLLLLDTTLTGDEIALIPPRVPAALMFMWVSFWDRHPSWEERSLSPSTAPPGAI
jgi:hypothetical protein